MADTHPLMIRIRSPQNFAVRIPAPPFFTEQAVVADSWPFAAATAERQSWQGQHAAATEGE